MDSKNVSLSEVHQTVSVPASKSNTSFWQRLKAFAGPAYLVSVGYMDPGNWATDIEGGASFGYTLLWVLLMSNMMALLLQTLSSRLGVVAGRDLAQACREYYPKPIAFALWILCEIAIIACDLAEVLGTAIGLYLLFGIPLVWGVLITALDVFLLLGLQKLGMKKLEVVIISMVGLIGMCFIVEMFLAKPDLGEMVSGLVPQLNDASLYVAIGIIGATVMPHNLYLHSALVQTRKIEPTTEGKRLANKFNLIDSAIALNAAFFINAAILVLSAAVFFKSGTTVTEIEQAHELLTPLLGTAAASILFAVALLASGQSSTVTGTLAGQIVMEGFLKLRISPPMRRLITRSLAIIPAVITILSMGQSSTIYLLILSQVVLSMQLSFAVIPLIKFTSSKEIMGEFANKLWVQVLSWLTAAIVLSLNLKLLYDKEMEALSSEGGTFTLGIISLPFLGGIVFLLTYVLIRKPRLHLEKSTVGFEDVVLNVRTSYERVGIAVEGSETDVKVIQHALAFSHQAHEVIFIHIATSAAGLFHRADSRDTAAREGERYLEMLRKKYASFFSGGHAPVLKGVLGYGTSSTELVRIVKESNIDVLVMGSHRHRGFKDLFFGTTVSPVRHALDIPIFIVQ